MNARLAILGAAAATLSMAALAAPASAQYYRGYDNYSRTITRCDGDGDRCATYRCDRDGDECRRVSGWYARSHLYGRNDASGYGYGGYNGNRYYDRDNRYTVRRCDRDGDDCRYRCDRDGDDCGCR